MKVLGVGRMADNPQALLVMFDREPSDDDIRILHEHLRKLNPTRIPRGGREGKEEGEVVTKDEPAKCSVSYTIEIEGGLKECEPFISELSSAIDAHVPIIINGAWFRVVSIATQYPCGSTIKSVATLTPEADFSSYWADK